MSRLGTQAIFDWSSTKQHLVAKSSTEAELIALADKSNKIRVQRLLLSEIGLLRPSPTPVFEDNQAARDILSDILYQGRTKHLDVRLRSVRELARGRVLSLVAIGTRNQLADIFTKPLAGPQHARLAAIAMGGGELADPPAREE